jgi:hypothetical protein
VRGGKVAPQVTAPRDSEAVESRLLAPAWLVNRSRVAWTTMRAKSPEFTPLIKGERRKWVGQQ